MERMAVTSFIMIGKETTRITNAALDSLPNPIQRMNKGASDIFGAVCTMITNGITIFSMSFTFAIIYPSAKPIAAPITDPTKISFKLKASFLFGSWLYLIIYNAKYGTYIPTLSWKIKIRLISPFMVILVKKYRGQSLELGLIWTPMRILTSIWLIVYWMKHDQTATVPKYRLQVIYRRKLNFCLAFMGYQ